MPINGDYSPVEFVTLGMFIIDDIYPPPSALDQTPQKDIIGGAGTYSAIGARLFSQPPHQSKAVGWIVDAGTDFPSDVRALIEGWETGCLFRQRDGLTTRGWNGYGDNEHRAFKYLTPKQRLTAEDLTPQLLASSSFHLICGAARCMEMTQRILERRLQELGEGTPRPLIIWEPVPDLCIDAEFDATVKACESVDVISPNHQELLALYNHPQEFEGYDEKAALENCAKDLSKRGIGPSGEGAVVVRCGKAGCFYIKATGRSLSERHFEEGWVPAFHQDGEKVVDPTGGGNGFLGGLAVGMIRNESSTKEAVVWGNIAASFCIEQVGIPKLEQQAEGPGQEQWNGQRVSKRLEEYQKKLI